MQSQVSLIWSLSKEISDGSKLFFITTLFKIVYFVFSRKLFKLKGDYELPVYIFGGAASYFLQKPMDLAALHEVYVKKEYFGDDTIISPEVVVDLGAHFGDTALYYSLRYPEAKIVAVEPEPHNFARLQKHAEQRSNIYPVNAAVGSQDGEIDLYVMTSTLGHSLKPREGAVGSVTVRQVSLRTLFSEAAITRAGIIKFDIEGAEYDLFSEINPTDYADSYIGEIHLDLGTFSLDDFCAVFKDYTVKIDKISQNRFLFLATYSKEQHAS